MTHGVFRVTSCQVVAPYVLRLEFDDGTCRRIDFSSVLKGRLLSPLRDLSLFNQVKLDPEAHTVVWPNDADFDPETLHDWPKYAAGLAALAGQWPAGDEVGHAGEPESRIVADEGREYGGDDARE